MAISPIENDLEARCPTCTGYLGKLIEGKAVFRCRKCKVEYKAEAVQVCRIEIRLAPIEDKCNNLNEAA